jgi:hypothetical protein
MHPAPHGAGTRASSTQIQYVVGGQRTMGHGWRGGVRRDEIRSVQSQEDSAGSTLGTSRDTSTLRNMPFLTGRCRIIISCLAV